MADNGLTADELDEYAGHLADLIKGVDAAFDGIDSAVRAVDEMEELRSGHPHGRYRRKIDSAIRQLRNVKEHAEQWQKAAENVADLRAQEQQEQAPNGAS